MGNSQFLQLSHQRVAVAVRHFRRGRTVLLAEAVAAVHGFMLREPAGQVLQVKVLLAVMVVPLLSALIETAVAVVVPVR